MITCPYCGRTCVSTAQQQCRCEMSICDQPSQTWCDSTTPMPVDQPTILLDPQLTRPASTSLCDLPTVNETAFWPMTPSHTIDDATSPYALSHPQPPPPPPIHVLHRRASKLHQWNVVGSVVALIAVLALNLSLQSTSLHRAAPASTSRASGAFAAGASLISSRQPSLKPGQTQTHWPSSPISPPRHTKPRTIHVHRQPEHEQGRHHGKHAR